MAFFRPRQILTDMLRCSNGERVEPWWASTWWALWIVGSFGGNVAGRLFFDADTIDGLRKATIADAISSTILVVTAPIAVIVVRRTTEALERKRAQIALAPVSETDALAGA